MTETSRLVGGPKQGVNYPIDVLYCGNCSMPIEYCEYYPEYERCKQWLERNLPTEFEKIKVIDDSAEGAGDEEKKRQKRGGIDLKVAAKFFGTKFACGSSVTGDDEIVIQGDVKDDLFDVIPEKWPEIDEDLIEDLGDQKR
ncbi:hypothetical protein FQA39_LY03264 [Lamprigera yunnana]|nr:hypothetical protein FQA39_LY03264 [Lamprigera yunnana]